MKKRIKINEKTFEEILGTIIQTEINIEKELFQYGIEYLLNKYKYSVSSIEEIIECRYDSKGNIYCHNPKVFLLSKIPSVIIVPINPLSNYIKYKNNFIINVNSKKYLVIIGGKTLLIQDKTPKPNIKEIPF